MEVALFLVILFMRLLAAETGGRQDQCKESRCSGDGPAIRFPFRLKDQPNHCGYPGFQISCSPDKYSILELPSSLNLRVTQINYNSQEISVFERDYCKNFSLSSSPFQFVDSIWQEMYIFSCSERKPDPGNYLTPAFCGFRPSGPVYAVSSSADLSDYDLSSCTMIYTFSAPWSYGTFYGEYSYFGFSMNWSKPACGDCEVKGKECRLKDGTNSNQPQIECVNPPPNGVSNESMLTGIVLGPSLFMILVAVIVWYNIYTSDKSKAEHTRKLKKFLEDYEALKPSRYTYADIKKITNMFKDKLGEGGYGVVYKGRLSTDVFVAVKVLSDSRENGEEFINEVGIMGRIHHINVVRLVGFCADGRKRALIYEFLPNGSLEKVIFKNQSLGWQKLHNIALGIARGIEYLHQGCDQRILHFDIKPSNVLLDQNFNPKITDFGLAKLCSKEQSIISMTTARGTMGYIAPEVLSRNFGNVSHKSDVYSFGMLLIEMVGGRRNNDLVTGNASKVYFPEWLYDNLEQKGEVNIRIEEEDDIGIAKKLSIVGLWCIQWYPLDRPSMKSVIKMLEGEDDITFPPNPFATSHPTRTDVRRRRTTSIHQELTIIPELE